MERDMQQFIWWIMLKISTKTTFDRYKKRKYLYRKRHKMLVLSSEVGSQTKQLNKTFPKTAHARCCYWNIPTDACLSQDADPLKFWVANATNTVLQPLLLLVASVSAVPATEAICERLFKTGGQVLTSSRLRLLGSRVESILMTNFNSQLADAHGAWSLMLLLMKWICVWNFLCHSWHSRIWGGARTLRSSN